MTKREAKAREQRAESALRHRAVDALAALALAHRKHVVAVRKLAAVTAGVANEIAAASAAQAAELTALRTALVDCFGPRDDVERPGPRRVVRRA